MDEPAGEPTFCCDCDHHFVVQRGDGPHRWLCLRHKRLDARSFVDRANLLSAPYVPCHLVNHGLCPLFQRARGAEPSP